VPDVKLERESLERATTETRIEHSNLDVGILSTVALVGLVESVNTDEVVSRDGKITALEVVDSVETEKKTHPRQGSPTDRTIPIPGFSENGIDEETKGGAIENSTIHVLDAQIFGNFSRKLDPSAGPEGSRFPGFPVISDEITMGDAIAVEKYEEFAFRAANSFV